MSHDFQNPLLHAQKLLKTAAFTTHRETASVKECTLLSPKFYEHYCPSITPAQADTWPEAEVLIDRALAITQYATRCAASSALCNQSPGSLAFGRDMLINIPFIADFLAVRNARQLKIDQRLLRANAKRRPHNFSVKDQIYVRNITAKSKLDPAWEGPFPIVQVRTNAAVTFARPNGVHESWNIRQIKPSA